jgi:FdhD protein
VTGTGGAQDDARETLERIEEQLLGRPASMGRREVSSAAEVSTHSARRFWHAMGFQVVEDEETMFTEADLDARIGRRTVTTGCGQGTMFGDLMDSLDDIRLPAHARLSQEVLYTVMDRARRHESIYKVAGAVHGCALCSNAGEDRGEILQFVEDVGRHNAVDAIAGWMWLEGIDGADKIFYTTGRLTSEMVIKCAQIGVPFLLSRSGLTQMGFELAGRLGITMIGRCQGKHYLLFSGGERFIAPGATLLA